MATRKPSPASAPVDYEAYFNVVVPGDIAYMHNVMLTFANAIPDYCHRYCVTSKPLTRRTLRVG